MEETMMVEYMDIMSLKLYKCLKVNVKVDGEVLFIFKLRNCEYKGQPDTLNHNIICHRPNYSQYCIESSLLFNLSGSNRFLRTIYEEITCRGDLFFYSKTDQQLAQTLTRLIKSYYRFSAGVLSASSDYSLVFVVEVGRAYATQGYIEAEQRMLKKPRADYENEKSEDVIVIRTSVNNEILLSDDVDVNMTIDDMDDCDCRSVITEDGFDEDTEEEEEEEEEFEEMDEEALEKEQEMNDIINQVRIWQKLPQDFELVLEEIKPLITYEYLEWDLIGKDLVVAKKEEKRGECAICLLPYTAKVEKNHGFTSHQETNCDTVVVLGCGHSFDHRCIFKRLEENQTCPLCEAVTYVTV